MPKGNELATRGFLRTFEEIRLNYAIGAVAASSADVQAERIARMPVVEAAVLLRHLQAYVAANKSAISTRLRDEKHPVFAIWFKREKDQEARARARMRYAVRAVGGLQTDQQANDLLAALIDRADGADPHPASPLCLRERLGLRDGATQRDLVMAIEGLSRHEARLLLDDIDRASDVGLVNACDYFYECLKRENGPRGCLTVEPYFNRLVLQAGELPGLLIFNAISPESARRMLHRLEYDRASGNSHHVRSWGQDYERIEDSLRERSHEIPTPLVGFDLGEDFVRPADAFSRLAHLLDLPHLASEFFNGTARARLASAYIAAGAQPELLPVLRCAGLLPMLLPQSDPLHRMARSSDSIGLRGRLGLDAEVQTMDTLIEKCSGLSSRDALDLLRMTLNHVGHCPDLRRHFVNTFRDKAVMDGVQFGFRVDAGGWERILRELLDRIGLPDLSLTLPEHIRDALARLSPEAASTLVEAVRHAKQDDRSWLFGTTSVAHVMHALEDRARAEPTLRQKVRALFSKQDAWKHLTSSVGLHAYAGAARNADAETAVAMAVAPSDDPVIEDLAQAAGLGRRVRRARAEIAAREAGTHVSSQRRRSMQMGL